MWVYVNMSYVMWDAVSKNKSPWGSERHWASLSAAGLEFAGEEQGNIRWRRELRAKELDKDRPAD